MGLNWVRDRILEGILMGIRVVFRNASVLVEVWRIVGLLWWSWDLGVNVYLCVV